MQFVMVASEGFTLPLYPLPSLENPTSVPYWSYFYICSFLKRGDGGGGWCAMCWGIVKEIIQIFFVIP